MFEEKPTIASKLRAWFYKQPSNVRNNIRKYGILAAGGLIMLGIYYVTGQDDKNKLVPETSHVETTPQDDIVSKDIVNNLKKDIKDSKEETHKLVQDALQQAIVDGKLGLYPPASSTPATGTSTGSDPASAASTESAKGNANGSGQTANSDASGGYPGAAAFPPPATFNDSGQQSQQTQQQQDQPQPQWVGEISQDDSIATTPVAEKDDAGKKGKIQLPVGFMKARLLVGVNALTGEFGSENPQTVMFRVQTPAQLPNYIKMNLAGCFAVANVNGNLSAERVITLPVSMNCITNDVGSGKKYVVEGPIKGFVSDKDGKRDMSARVVSRAGTLLASAVFAKSIEGFGNFVSTQGATQNVSPLGSVNTFKTDELAKSGAATGVGSGLTEVSKYLLKLVEQTAPTMETGAGKDVTLFIQETAELEIKEVRIKS